MFDLQELNGPMPSDVTAYPLVRYSTKKQEEGSSEARQLAHAEQECNRRRWKFNIDLTILDEGVSAFKRVGKAGEQQNFSVKSALGRFLEAAKKGRLLPNPVLIVENPDRFSRAELEVADSTLWALVKSGVGVLFLSNGLLLRKGDENNFLKRMMLMAEFSRSHEDSARKSKLILDSITLKLEEASKGVAVNLGAWLPSWINFVSEPPKPDRYEFNPACHEIVLRIIQLFLENESANGIARRFNRENIRTFGGGKRWSSSTIRQILTSESLLGHATIGNRKFENLYPNVVNQDQWTRIQARFSRRNPAGGGTAQGLRINNLFPGRVFCHSCGHAMMTNGDRKSRDVNWRYTYSCRSKHLGDSDCTGQTIRTEIIEMDFFGLYLMQSPAEALLSNDDDRQAKMAALQVKIRNLDAQIARATELVMEVPVDELKKNLVTWNTQRVTAQREMDTLRYGSRVIADCESAWLDILEELGGNRSSDDLRETLERMFLSGTALKRQLENQDTRRRLVGLLRSLVHGIVVDIPNARYRVKSLTGALGEWRDLSSGVAVFRSWTEERRQAHSAKMKAICANRGKQIWTEERRRKHSQKLKEFWSRPEMQWTEEERREASIKMKEIKARPDQQWTPEMREAARQRLAQNRHKMRQTEAGRQRKSQFMKNWHAEHPHNTVRSQAIREGVKRHYASHPPQPLSEDWKNEISRALKKHYSEHPMKPRSEAHRKAHSESLKRYHAKKRALQAAKSSSAK